MKGKAGWGWVAVCGDQEYSCGHGPVEMREEKQGYEGAENATNNTGELTAIIGALRDVEKKGRKEVMIRFDSTYAAMMIRGLWKPKKNKRLIERGKVLLNTIEARGTKVWWNWVKGHSGHKWNDRADALADEGREEMEGGTIGDTDSGRKLKAGRQKPGGQPRKCEGQGAGGQVGDIRSDGDPSGDAQLV